MSEVDYGAIHGTYQEWDEGDLAAARAQQASMDAQRSTGAAQQRARSLERTWGDLSSAERQVLIDYESGDISEEDAERQLLALLDK